MIYLTYLKKFKIFFIYIFFYLISAEFAISQSQTNKILSDLENGLNKRDFGVIKKYFGETESKKIKESFANLIKEFPNAKWTIKNNNNKDYADINISGSKFVNGKIFILKSNFNYHYLLKNGKIENGIIKSHLTTIRNDKNLIDINFSIPNNVLTGTNYDIDIIVNNPLENDLIAGGIKAHQVDSIIKPTIKLEPLVSGGIFKVTRAPVKPGMQIWSGIIAHPKGLISFTKTVSIIKEK